MLTLRGCLVGVVAVLLVSGAALAQAPMAPKEPRSALLLDGWEVAQFGFRVDLTKTGSSVDVIDRVRINNRCDFEWTRRSSREFLRLTKSLSTENSSQKPALDARAEHEVFQRFGGLTSGKMTVLVSRRFSTVRMADRILVLTKARVVEDGTHAALVTEGGLYAELFALRAEGYR